MTVEEMLGEYRTYHDLSIVAREIGYEILQTSCRQRMRQLLKSVPAYTFKPFHDRSGTVFEDCKIIKSEDGYYAAHANRLIPVKRHYFCGEYFVEESENDGREIDLRPVIRSI